MDEKRWRCPRLTAAILFGIAVLSSSPAVWANDMDPVLARMWRYNTTTQQIETRDDLFDALALDLAMAMSPGVMHPAETLGWSGFFMGLEATLTVIDAEANQWRCGVENTGGGHGGDGACDNWNVADGAVFVPAVHVRKGLPYSLELGFQIQYMANSELVAIGGEIRWAPFEGYREGWAGYLPDLAVSFSGNYLMGSSELVLGQFGANFSISYPFTISGQAVITPYFGYQFFIVGADHEQVFNSEYVDVGEQQFEANHQCQNPISGTMEPCSPFIEFHDGLSRNFGQDLDTLKYHRLYLGARVLWENLTFTPQFSLAMPWYAGDANGRTLANGYQNTEVHPHFQFSVSVGADF